MKWKNYAILCVVITCVVAGCILLFPGLSNTIEGVVLGFLSSNA